MLELEMSIDYKTPWAAETGPWEPSINWAPFYMLCLEVWLWDSRGFSVRKGAVSE